MVGIKVKTKVVDKDNGFKKLAAELGGMGTLTLGVQGKEAEETHPSGKFTVGQLALMHELGVGVPERSWLRVWMDENQQRMLAEVRAGYASVMNGTSTRKKVLSELGYKWVAELRKNIADGRIKPPLAPSTVAKKGHAIPLLETGTLANSITYKLFMKQIKSVKDRAERMVLRGQSGE